MVINIELSPAELTLLLDILEHSSLGSSYYPEFDELQSHLQESMRNYEDKLWKLTIKIRSPHYEKSRSDMRLGGEGYEYNQGYIRHLYYENKNEAILDMERYEKIAHCCLEKFSPSIPNVKMLESQIAELTEEDYK